MQDRLNRHRIDIEDLKSRYNGLLRYLESLGIIPAAPAATSPTPEERYQ